MHSNSIQGAFDIYFKCAKWKKSRLVWKKLNDEKKFPEKIEFAQKIRRLINEK